MTRPKKPDVFLQTPELYALVAARWAKDHGWIVLGEVRNSTGFGATRSADAVVVGLWPSHGHQVLGVEIKRDRHDWLRELRTPKKANTMQAFCDAWLVVANPGVVQPEDVIPETWGLLVPNAAGTALVTHRQAVYRTPAERAPLARPFVASLLRRALEGGLAVEQLNAARAEARKEGEARHRYELDRVTQALQELQERVRAFETASGVQIAERWTAGDVIGRAVRAVLDHDVERMARAQRQLAGQARMIAERAEAAAEALEAVQPPLELSA